MANSKLYCLFDKVSNSPNSFQRFVNDSSACRFYMRTLYSQPSDFEIRCLADILEDGSVKFYESPVVASWDSYKLPDSEAEALSPFKMSKDEFLREMAVKYDMANKSN